jgi:ubiquinone/menaquinone biosynthesis C-methylase UbiE
LAKKRFKLYDLTADLRVDDAEHLSFEDNTFDEVYSFGVLHHTPDTEQSIREVWRVLRKGGTAVVMLFHRSLNYVVHRLLRIPADGSRSDPVPVARTYSRNQARRLFSPFSKVQVDVDYLFGTGWGVVNRLMPVSLHHFLGRYVGWPHMIQAAK